MAYCSRCGVEVEDQVDYCPLCRAPIQRFSETGEPVLPSRPPHTEQDIKRVRRTTREKRQFILVLLSVIFLAPTLITLAVEYVISHSLNWSLITMFSIGAVWAYSCIPFLFFKKPYGMFAGYFTSTVTACIGINLVTGAPYWSLIVALPIAGLLFFIISLVFLWGSRVKENGFNIPAFILIGIVVFALGTEGIVDLFIHQGLFWDWSLIVSAALIPFIFMFLFFHYRSRKKLDLDKIFHL